MSDSSHIQDEGSSQTKNIREITIFDILTIITRQRKIIVRIAVSGILIILLFILITKLLPATWPFNPFPDFYEPKVQISIQESRASLMSKSSSASSVMSLLSKGGASAQNPNLELAQVILDGYMVTDKILDEFHLIKNNELTTKSPAQARSDARERFKKKLLININKNNPSSTIFSISYHDIDSDLATNVLNRTIELLEDRFRELTLFQVTLRKSFIEDRLLSTEKDLQIAENKIVQFDVKHGIIDISRQAQEQTSLVADLSSDLIKKELELKTLLEYFPENSTKVILLKKEIDKKKELINDIKNGLPGSSIDVIPQNKIPSLTAEYLDLKGELEMQTKIFAMLREQLELVKIDENDNSQIFQIIEPAEYLKVKSGPLRNRIVIIGCAASLVLAFIVAFIFDYLMKLIKVPSESRKWEAIKQMVITKKKKIRK
jgi:uncharacterized protein involved in exopolysaccharide biosynthesis